MSVGIVVDSSTDLDPGWAAAHGITVAAMHIMLPQGAYRDDAISREELYRLMAEAPEPPRYNGVPNRELWKVYEDVLRAHDSAIVLLMPFAENPVWAQATGATRRIPDGLNIVKVLMTGVGLAGQAALAVASAMKAASGALLGDMTGYVEDRATRSECLVVPRTLDWLRKAGSMGMLQAKLGPLDGKIPVLRAANSLQGVAAAGSREEAIPRMLDRAAERLGERESVVVVSHALDKPAGEALLAQARTRLHPREAILTEMGPIAGAYLGPGGLGLGYCPV